MAAIIANELIEDEILPSFSSSHNVKNKKSVWDIRMIDSRLNAINSAHVVIPSIHLQLSPAFCNLSFKSTFFCCYFNKRQKKSSVLIIAVSTKSSLLYSTVKPSLLR
jgi:hypothetical protein